MDGATGIPAAPVRERLHLEPGDCREVMSRMAAAGEQFDACVTDPPYDLTSIVKRFGGANAAPAKFRKGGVFQRQSRGFMGKTWDGTGVAFDPETWQRVYDVLKPGAHLLAFGGTRTYHRMTCAIEDAGFEVRDCILYMFGTGFPKSHAVSVPGFEGYGTALKPSYEPCVLARKPLVGTVAENVEAFGTGSLNIDASRIESGGTHGSADNAGAGGGRHSADLNRKVFGRGLGGVVMPPHPAGRWPSNVIHDGSDEVMQAFSVYGESKSPPVGSMGGGSNSHAIFGDFAGKRHTNGHGDTGTPARFFYTSKAGSEDRADSKHPTVKPLDLLRYLIRLVTPPNGIVLDPFAGSGTTLHAAHQLGFRAVGIEREPEYQADIQRRIAKLLDPDQREFAWTP